MTLFCFGMMDTLIDDGMYEKIYEKVINHAIGEGILNLDGVTDVFRYQDRSNLPTHDQLYYDTIFEATLPAYIQFYYTDLCGELNVDSLLKEGTREFLHNILLANSEHKIAITSFSHECLIKQLVKDLLSPPEGRPALFNDRLAVICDSPRDFDRGEGKNRLIQSARDVFGITGNNTVVMDINNNVCKLAVSKGSAHAAIKTDVQGNYKTQLNLIVQGNSTYMDRFPDHTPPQIKFTKFDNDNYVVCQLKGTVTPFGFSATNINNTPRLHVSGGQLEVYPYASAGLLTSTNLVGDYVRLTHATRVNNVQGGGTPSNNGYAPLANGGGVQR